MQREAEGKCKVTDTVREAEGMCTVTDTVREAVQGETQ